MTEPERSPKDKAKEAADGKHAMLISLLLAPFVIVLWLLFQWHEMFAFTRIPQTH